MSPTQDELQKIAEKLTKIPWADSKILWDLTNILGYMDRLSEIDTQGVVPTISVSDGVAQLREDMIQDINKTSSQELLQSTEQKVVGNMIVLPNIMK